MIYLNLKTTHGVETVDELDPKDFENRKAFRLELNRLISEYYLCSMNVYKSTRCTKEWKER